MSTGPSSHSSSSQPPSQAREQQEQLPQQSHAHAPLVPSNLRQSYAPSESSSVREASSSAMTDSNVNRSDDMLSQDQPQDQHPPPHTQPTLYPHPHPHTHHGNIDFDNGGLHPSAEDTPPGAESTERPAQGEIEEPSFHNADAAASLVGIFAEQHVCGDEHCDHGALSPRAPTISTTRGDEGDTNSERAWIGASATSSIRERHHKHNHSTTGSDSAAHGGLLGGGNGGHGHNQSRLEADGSTAKWLAQRNRKDAKGRRRMYLAYYFPFLNWVVQYQWSFFKGDLIAAITMASFYIPMALSYADNLGHLPPINGLYAFAVNPLIYAFLGTCPQMVVGPEAAGSLLVGGVVRSSVDKGYSGENEGMMHARIAGVVTGMAGAIILIAGLTRLGFLDSVLSRPFLRGFISAIGVVILADQLIPEMGLTDLAKKAGVDHESSWQKVVFLMHNVNKAHGLTCAVSFTAFMIIMICRTLKQSLQPRRPWIAYIPDRFLIVVLSAIFAYQFDWEGKGIEVLGDVMSGTGQAFPIHFPFVPSYMKHVREAMSTSFLIALLGFFESSVAAKSLGDGDKKPGEGIRGVALSPNRELVALGVANLVGGFFMALPAFGGYGRSKVNASTGGKTPMSSIFLSLITILCVFFLLPYFYYIPKGVLSAMVSVVAYSLVEECPHDLRFFIKIRGWSELTLMFVIFFATIFYSLPLGIAFGMGISILSVIRHATKPRIQILGKIPGTLNQFENAETNPHDVEFVEGCLIVKIPEPLTFANTGDLKNRLRRLELYGTTNAHPALPRIRAEEHNQNIIFDVHGVTGLDGSGSQVLYEIVAGYVDIGVRVFFCRVPNPRSQVFRLFVRSGIVEKCGGMRHFVKSADEALALAAETREISAFHDQEDPPV